MKKSITLVLPNLYKNSRAIDIDSKEPLGILYIASYLRERGYHVDLIDASTYGLSVEQTVKLISMTDPVFIGFSVVQRAFGSTIEIIKMLRKNGVKSHISIGGYLPSLSIEYLSKMYDLLKLIDSIVVGEGEITSYELAETIINSKNLNNINGLVWINGKDLIYNKLRNKISNLDSIPFPSRDLLPKALATMGTASIFSSRGCYGNCTFCSQNAFDKYNKGIKWRGRSATNVVDEIEYLINTFGVKTIKFNDDNIFGPGVEGKKRVIDICNEILKRRIKVSLMAYCRANDVDKDIVGLMKSAGFDRILLGVETVNDDILKKYKKGVKFQDMERARIILEEAGISSIPGYMMFNPYSNLEDIKKSIEYLRTVKAFGSTISKTVVIHDSTDIKETLKKEKRLVENEIIAGYHDYIVDEDVSKVYLLNKYFWIYYIDPMNRNSKFIINYLKKRDSFNDREEWENVLKTRWEIQAKYMESSIEWVKHKNINRMESEINKYLNEFYKVSNYILELLPKLHSKEIPIYNIGYFNLDGLDYFMDVYTSKIIAIKNENLKDDIFNFSNNQNLIINKENREFIEKNFTSKKYNKINYPNNRKLIDISINIMNEKTNKIMERYDWQDYLGVKI